MASADGGRMRDFVAYALGCVIGLALATSLPLAATPSPTPTLSPGPSILCLVLLQATHLSGQKITPENIGKLYGEDLAIRLQSRTHFSRADLDGANNDIAECFHL